MSTMQPRRLAFLIRLVHQALRHELDSSVRPLGLTMPKVAVLAALKRRAGASSAELARAAFVSAQSMGEVLASLEAEGLISKAPDGGNNRILRAAITAKGAAAMQRADRQIERVEERLVAALGPADARVLRELLQRCADALHGDAILVGMWSPGRGDKVISGR
jgi:DNA-binding MarR family transcriptional regulator